VPACRPSFFRSDKRQENKNLIPDHY